MLLDYEKVFGFDTKLSVRLSRVANESESGGSLTRFGNSDASKVNIRSTYAHADVLHRLADNRSVSLKLQTNHVANDYVQQPYFNVTQDFRNTQENSFFEAELQGKSDLGPSKYVYGTTFRRTVTDGFFIDGPARYTHTATAYAQLEQELGKKTQGFAGILFYNQNRTGFDHSPKLSVLHRLDDHKVIRVGWGKAFRAPDALANFFNPLAFVPRSMINPGIITAIQTDPALIGAFTALGGGDPVPLQTAAINQVNASANGVGTFTDLAGTPKPLFKGNTGLSNESIEQVDVGFEFRDETDLFKVDAWYSMSENLIVPNSVLNGPVRIAPGISFTGATGNPVADGILNGAFAQLPAIAGLDNQGLFGNIAVPLYSHGFHLELGHRFSKKTCRKRQLDLPERIPGRQIHGRQHRARSRPGLRGPHLEIQPDQSIQGRSEKHLYPRSPPRGWPGELCSRDAYFSHPYSWLHHG